ncbi:MAG: flagellar hook-basal body protein [Phycisphaerae bacterium]|jgi:flagellar basal body rod protein FlgG
MYDSVQATATNLSALSEYYGMITQNLANASTSGYKRQGAAFDQVLAQAVAGNAVAARGGLDLSQGHLVETARPLDLALEGKGFFVIETADGPLYTRSGTFRLSSTGQLVDYAGRTVSGTEGPIILPQSADSSSIHVASDGRISVGPQQVGQVKVVEFEDSSGLTPVGGGCYDAPDSTQPDEAKATSVHQGYNEASNVSVVEELVELIKVTRAYEANLKTVQTHDERYRNLLKVASGL